MMNQAMKLKNAIENAISEGDDGNGLWFKVTPALRAALDSARAEGEPPQPWKCKARSANTGANDPQDCDWPTCGCDPYADKVIAALQESGINFVRAGEQAAPGRDELRERVVAHLDELADAWQRGALSSHDMQNGPRSNRNMDLLIDLRRAALTAPVPPPRKETRCLVTRDGESVDLLRAAHPAPVKDARPTNSWWCCKADYPNHEPSCRNYEAPKDARPTCTCQGRTLATMHDKPCPIHNPDAPTSSRGETAAQDSAQHKAASEQDSPRDSSAPKDAPTLREQAEKLRDHYRASDYRDSRHGTFQIFADQLDNLLAVAAPDTPSDRQETPK